MERTVLYSDLSGEMIQGPEDHAVVTVTNHPDLDDPVRLDARPNELERLDELSIEAVLVQVERPDEEPTVHVLPVEEFNKLAGEGMEMEAILAGATPAVMAVAARRRNHNRRSDGGPLINYGDPDYAGVPHKGKVGDDEKRIVQTNLEEVNKRLLAQRIRPIDPANPEHAERYGLGSVTALLQTETAGMPSQATDGTAEQVEPEGHGDDAAAAQETNGPEDPGEGTRRRRTTRR